tara:strand:+ start:2364 stop:2660 length:297 start_codon:yes stop_codon:yes gene_type:complete
MHEESYKKSIGNFLSWASDRIEREVEQNKKCERDFGTAVLIEDSHRESSKLSDETKIERVEQVQKIVRDCPWKTVAEACLEAKLYHTTYYKWKKEHNK